jgi:hypothetical protein
MRAMGRLRGRDVEIARRGMGAEFRFWKKWKREGKMTDGLEGEGCVLEFKCPRLADLW